MRVPTAAIRRYQIRNGLKITGELNTETQRSLRVTGTSSTQPRMAPKQEPSDDNPDLRDEDARPSQPPPPQYRSPREAAPPIYSPEPYRYRQETGIFYGTPYENAPFDIQQRVIADAQIFLARRGYYRSEIDGLYGPGTEFALRAFQSRSGLPLTGRFDGPTLGALGLMPGRRVPGSVRTSSTSRFSAPSLSRRVDSGLTTFARLIISSWGRIAPIAIPRRPIQQKFARRCEEAFDRDHRKSKLSRDEICDEVQGRPFSRSCLAADRA